MVRQNAQFPFSGQRKAFLYKFVLRGTDDFLTFLTVSRQEFSVSRFFGKCKFEIKSYRFNFVGKASASLSLDGTLSKILAMKFNAVSFFPCDYLIPGLLCHQRKSGICLQEGTPPIFKKSKVILKYTTNSLNGKRFRFYREKIMHSLYFSKNLPFFFSLVSRFSFIRVWQVWRSSAYFETQPSSKDFQ